MAASLPNVELLALVRHIMVFLRLIPLLPLSIFSFSFYRVPFEFVYSCLRLPLPISLSLPPYVYYYRWIKKVFRQKLFLRSHLWSNVLKFLGTPSANSEENGVSVWEDRKLKRKTKVKNTVGVSRNSKPTDEHVGWSWWAEKVMVCQM